MQPARRDKPERVYSVNVNYSLHCFTRSLVDGEVADPTKYYSDDRETRIFDERRYELSLRLPSIIDDLMSFKCFHTGRGNFFTVRILDEQGSRVEYEIYFTASRSSNRGIVNLFVQSAYVRDQAHQNRPRRRPAIRFDIILHNVLNNREIREPR